MLKQIFFLTFISFAATFGATGKSALEVRFLAEVIPKALGQVVLANAKLKSEPFNLPMNNLSLPQQPPSRVFSVWSLKKNMSLANVKLPEEGTSFIVLLLRSSKGIYKPVIMPGENPSFKGGDVYFYNNSNKTVLGILGAAKFTLAPGKSTIVTPTGFGDKNHYYAMLGVREPDKNKIIKSMNWRSSKTLRSYIFFYEDPKKKRVTYRGVDEFIASGKSK